MKNVFVHVHVKKEFIDEFIQATLNNAKNSIDEDGIQRFDFLQDDTDSSRFILIEVYKNDEAPAKHKETDHYKTWRKSVENMMEEPRKGLQYRVLFSGDGAWGK